MSDAPGDVPAGAAHGLGAEVLHWVGSTAGRLARVETLAELAQAVQDVLDRFATFDHSGLYLRDPETGRMRMLRAKGFTPEQIAESERTAIDRHPGWVYKHRKPLRIDDTDRLEAGSPSRDSAAHPSRVRSRLWLPVLTQDDCVGAFGLASVHPNAFTQWDVDLLGLVCNLTAIAYERIVATLRREAAEKQLVRARDDAEAANRAKSEFLATMSHEIRTPMNGVLGMATLLGETELGAQQREMVGAIQTSGEALLALIDDILDLSRIEAQRLDLVEERFSVDELVDGVLDLLGPRAQSKGLELAAVIAPDVPPVLFGDAARLRQVLVNLTGNAVKFTESGEVRVEVSRRDGAIELAVRDSGIGIADHDLARLFRPFSQVDAGPGRRFGGSGLGLAISRRLVDLMGGSVGVESTKDVGSRFHARVRLRAADDAAEWPGPAAGLRVLVADPSELAREVLRAALAGLATPPVEVSTEQGLLLELGLGADRFDVAFVDRRLVGRAALAALAVARTTRVVVSGALTDSRHAAIARAGLDVFLAKPLKRSRVRQIVVSAARGESLAPVGPGPSLLPAPRTGPRVLVVEDNEINARLALLMLERLGVAADLARDGAEAVARVEARAYDAALMDCDMPGVDGYEATRRIRALEAQPGWGRPRLRIVAMTANAMVGERERCLACGMDDFLTKPVKLGLLRDRFGGSRASSAPPGPATAPALGPEFGSLVRDLGAAEAARFASAWLAEADARLAAARAHAEAGDRTQLRRGLHAWTGQSSAFGLDRLCAACARLEAIARAETTEGLSEAIDALAFEARAAKAALEAALAALGRASG